MASLASFSRQRRLQERESENISFLLSICLSFPLSSFWCAASRAPHRTPSGRKRSRGWCSRSSLSFSFSSPVGARTRASDRTLCCQCPNTGHSGSSSRKRSDAEKDEASNDGGQRMPLPPRLLLLLHSYGTHNWAQHYAHCLPSLSLLWWFQLQLCLFLLLFHHHHHHHNWRARPGHKLRKRHQALLGKAGAPPVLW